MLARPARRFVPLTVDFSKLHECRDQIVTAMSGTISPMFAIRNHGLEQYIQDAVHKAAALTHPKGQDPEAVVVDADEESSFTNASSEEPLPVASLLPADTADAFQEKCVAVTEEVLVCLLGLADRTELESILQQRGPNGSHIGGTGTVRRYPHWGRGVLGAHVDMNLITLLWSNGPGFEVIDPTLKNVNPQQIKGYGTPMTTVDASSFFEFSDDHWVSVTSKWCHHDILVTIGGGWFDAFVDPRTAIDAAALPNLPTDILCPVYHRVLRRPLAPLVQDDAPPVPVTDDTTDVSTEVKKESKDDVENVVASPSAEDEVNVSRPKAVPTESDLTFGTLWDRGRFSFPFLARIVHNDDR